MSLNPFYYTGPTGRQIDRGKRRHFPGDHIAYVGRTFIPKRGSEHSDQSAHNYDDVFPRFRDYKLPSRSPLDERFVLDQLCSHIRTESDLGAKALRLGNEVLLDCTAKSKQPCWFIDGLPRIDDVVDAIMAENRTKHPGFPGCVLAATKGVLIDRYLPDLVMAIYARLLALRYVGPYCSTAEDFFETFCSDLTAFSIKPEVIKVGKNGRGLCAVSIVTTCVETLLYGCFDVAFKSARYENYSAIGIGFTRADSDLLHLASPKPSMCSDVPMFDSTVTPMENELNARNAMASQGIQEGPILTMALQLERSFSLKLFVLSNGWIYLQLDPGYMCTGRRETSNFNTKTRARRSMAVDVILLTRAAELSPKTVCAGDDCNETPHPDKEAVYAELGFPLRDVTITDDLTFCSHDWPVGQRPVGQRIHKAMFKLFLNLPVDAERFTAICREFGEHPDFPAYYRNISAIRPEMNSVTSEMISNLRFKDDLSPLYDACAKKKKAGVPKARKQGPKPAPKLAVARAPKPHPAVKMAHVHAACSITDPFCSHARAAKRPDGLGATSIGAHVHYITTISTDAAGKAFYTLVPGIGRYGVASGTLAASTWTLQAGWTSLGGSGFVDANAAEVRIVSMGAILRSICSATDSKGIVDTFVVPNPVVSGTFSEGSANYPEFKRNSLRSTREIAWIAKPAGAHAHSFRPYAEATTTMSDFDWTSLGIEVLSGPASTPVLDLEIFVNVEFTLKNSSLGASGLASAVTKPRPANPVALKAQNAIHSKMESFVEGGISTVEKKVASFASSALSAVEDFGLGMLFG